MRSKIQITPGPNDLVVIVDMQKDFVTGALGSEQAQAIVPAMVEFLKHTESDCIYTRDTHSDDYLNTQEGSRLPVPHGIKGTHGHELIPELQELIRFCDIIIDKPTFGSTELMDRIKAHHYDNIYFIGVCTGICVISNAIMAKAADTESRVAVIANLCACVSEQSHENALAAMETCQIYILEAA